MTQPAHAVVRQEPEILRAIANARIDWVLRHPGMSNWLKGALRSAASLDPLAIQNDVEMLRHLIALRASAEAETALAPSTLGKRSLIEEEN